MNKIYMRLSFIFQVTQVQAYSPVEFIGIFFLKLFLSQQQQQQQKKYE